MKIGLLFAFLCSLGLVSDMIKMHYDGLLSEFVVDMVAGSLFIGLAVAIIGMCVGWI